MSSDGLRILGLATIVIVVAACGSSDGPAGGGGAAGENAVDGAVLVYTVNYPLAYFAERVGGDRVRVEFPAPGGVDPAYWSPDADIVGAYQDADLVFRNGAGYAGWVDTATLPASRVVDTSASFHDSLIVVEDAVTHSHGPGGEHDHGATAFTTWLDPTLAVEHASAIQRALAGARPDRADEFRAGLDGLRADLEDLDRRFGVAFGLASEDPWLASHPVYQYLGRKYGVDLISMHFEPDVYPDEAEWRALQDAVGGRNVRRMLWEAEPLPETRERLAAEGIEVVVFEPCGNTPATGDYLAVMSENAGRLEAAVSP